MVMHVKITPNIKHLNITVNRAFINLLEWYISLIFIMSATTWHSDPKFESSLLE